MSNTNRNRDDEKHTAAGEESGMKQWMAELEAKVDAENARRRDGRKVEMIETDDGKMVPASLEDTDDE